MLSIDNAVCAPGQHSIENGITVPMADMTGPFDYHLTRRLLRTCTDHDLAVARDTFRYYRPDWAAAIESGAAPRAPRVACGPAARSGWQRPPIASVETGTRMNRRSAGEARG